MSRRRLPRAIFTACVVGMLGAGVFGIYNTVHRASRDHVAVTGYESARSCTADGVNWQSPSAWCRVTDLAADDLSVGSPLVTLDPSVDGTDPDFYDNLVTFYADFGTTASVPAQIGKVIPLTVITPGGSYNAASVTIGTQVYQTTASPLVQYTTDTESVIAAIGWTAFAFVWTVRRLIRGRGPALLRWISFGLLCGTAVGAFTAVAFVASHEDNGAVSTSITAAWLVPALFTLAAGAVTCSFTRHRLRRRESGD